MAFGGSIKAASAYVELSLRQGPFQKQWAEFQSRLRGLTTGLQRLGAGAVSLGLNTKAFFNGLKAATAAFTAAVARMRSAGRAIVFGGIITALPFAAALAELSKFDDKMRTVRAVSEASEQDFNRLTESAKRFGAQTRFSASEVADLMIELGRAGFVADEIDAMTLSILQLARATGTDTVTASVAAATAMRQFSLPVTDITRIVDNFTIAANASFASVESLTESFQYAGPILAQLGYSLEESLAIIGTLANFGIKGSEAGTAVRRIATISVAKAKEIEEILGASFVDAAGNARKLYDVLNEIQILTDGLGNAERATKFEEAFGLLGITSATVITQHGDNVLELLDRLIHGAGATAKAFEQMDAGIGGSFGRMLSKIKLIAVQLADTLTGAITSTEAILQDNFERLTDFIDRHKAIIPVIAQAIAAFTAAGIAVFALGVALSPIAAAMTILGALFGTLSAAVGLATTAIGLFAGALGLGGIPLAIVAIGTLIDAFKSVRLAAFNLAEDIKATFLGIAENVTGAIKGVKDAIEAGDLDLAFQIMAARLDYIWSQLMVRFKLNLLKFLDFAATQLEKYNLFDDTELQDQRARLLDRLRADLAPEFRGPDEQPEVIAARKLLRDAQLAQRNRKNFITPFEQNLIDFEVQAAEQRLAIEEEIASTKLDAAQAEERRARLGIELAQKRVVLSQDDAKVFAEAQKARDEARKRFEAAVEAAPPQIKPQAAEVAPKPGFQEKKDVIAALENKAKAANEKRKLIRDVTQIVGGVQEAIDQRVTDARKLVRQIQNLGLSAQLKAKPARDAAADAALQKSLEDARLRTAAARARAEKAFSDRQQAFNQALLDARTRTGRPRRGFDIEGRAEQIFQATQERRGKIEAFLERRLEGDKNPTEGILTPEQAEQYQKDMLKFEREKKQREKESRGIFDDIRKYNKKTSDVLDNLGIA